jgi:rSAM/selenodomain-associated transferase 2
VRSEEFRPELSVIIPTLNESETLPLLLGDLAAQQGVDCEVLVSDGGSTDSTPELAAALLRRYHLAGRVLGGPAGRGRQLNAGAAQARGEWLLFLHADSRLPEASALATALDALCKDASSTLAGHFALHFDLPATADRFAYYLLEAKAATGLPGTLHGDQGFLLRQRFFRQLGGFREDLPVLEDTLLAEKIRKYVGWRRLPASIITSPRRFQAEGYRQRQTLNALLVNFAMIGWDEPLRQAPSAYRSQDQTQPLTLAPFLRLVDDLLGRLPLAAQMQIWYRTGAFVRANAWQLVLQRQARRAWQAGVPPGELPLAPLLRWRHRFDRATDHPPGRLAAALLTWLWFRTRSRTLDQGA